VGISYDSPQILADFTKRHGITFPLLADADHAVAEKYGVWQEKSRYGRKYMGIIRSAFLIDERGRVEQAWYKVSPGDTVPNAMKVLAG